MKKTSYLVIALIAAALSVPAQAESIVMVVNTTTNPIGSPTIPPAGGRSSQGMCAFWLKSVTADFTHTNPGSNGIVDEPLTVKKNIDTCSQAWFPSTGLQKPFPTAAIYIYESDTPSSASTPIMVINLTNVYLLSLSNYAEEPDTGNNSEEWRLLATTINIVDKVANTSVTCDFTKGTCS